jgi:hypothetical protein
LQFLWKIKVAWYPKWHKINSLVSVPMKLKQIHKIRWQRPQSCVVLASSLLDYRFLSHLILVATSVDLLCGLVVRVLGYISGGPGSIPGTTRKKK